METRIREIPFVDLSAQHASLAAPIGDAIDDVIRKTNFILGEEVRWFEEEFAAFCETEHAVGVDSGTSALELTLRALGIGPGDEVITAANTFIATALAITDSGATPILVDVDPETCNIDPVRVEETVTARTRAIIPVHLYGQPAEMGAIMEIADRKGLAVVEDACQAHGARYEGRRAGSLGHAAAFSFYPSKNLGAYGDGGMVVTDDSRLAGEVRKLRNDGQSKKYHHDTRGFNRRLDTIQAAILRVKLPYLDEWNACRQQHAGHYDSLLADLPVRLPSVAERTESVYHLYVIQAEERDELQSHLREQGVSTGIHYPIPIHRQGAYAGQFSGSGPFPVTDRLARQALSLPMYPELQPEAVEVVADAIERFFH